MLRALLFTVLCIWVDPTSMLPLTLIASLARRSAPWVGISTLHHMVGSVGPIVCVRSQYEYEHRYSI
jgi:hypothetical protein